MTLVKMNPAKSFMNDRLFPSAFQTMFDELFENQSSTERSAFFHPKTDIAESDKAYFVELTLPGIKKEDIQIEIKDNRLEVRGERKLNKEEQNKKFHRIESSYGSFSRSFNLPEKVDKESIKAEFKDGVLYLELNKMEEQKAKSIVIK
ncbi:MAG: Hsp20/alpha crystallin family protein [Bacteroidetes bacterium]|nr:MAG: Hsp20/alpha crystallin family protein [Bacteroidota bacterium]